MKLSHSLITLLVSVNIAQGSSLDVYQDQTFYHYTQQNNFIGFVQGVSATCEGAPMALAGMSSCPEEERLCKELTELRSIEQKVQVTVANTNVLEKLISLPQPTTFDAVSWIESAKRIGEEQSRLLTQKKLLTQEVQLKQQHFRKQAPTKLALESSQVCKEEMELTIPYGYVTFSTRYEADLKENNEISVTQFMSITNRSGIDIEADTAMFYYRSANQHVYPTHFTPWIVSKYIPRPKRVSKSKKYRAEELQMDMAMMSEQRAAPSLRASAPVASYEDAREYKIKNLTLPSTGLPLDLPVLTWKTVLSCEVRAYPYEKRQAFHICSFKPKYQIDSNAWKVKSSSEVINENASGEYRDDKYHIYTKVEEDIKVLRKPIVQKERETGIFGGTARKKDGFTLTLTNKSDKAKTLTVIERIPTSTTEEIKVKLLEIKSAKKVNYKMLKDGKIEMKLTLDAHENKSIDVMFEISYDKDLKVNY